MRPVVARRRAHSWLAAAALLAACIACLALPGAAFAEASATRVILSYVPVVSNWGPTDANGVVEYTLSEGDVRADLLGLAQLDANQTYELWLQNTSTGEMYGLARFNPAPEGQTTFVDATLPGVIPDSGWDRVLLTVEPEPDDDPAASATIAIAGNVPGTPAELQQFPPILPETGEAPERATRGLSRGVEVAIVAAAGALASAGVLMMRRRLTPDRVANKLEKP
jgi:hypothetical protein